MKKNEVELGEAGQAETVGAERTRLLKLSVPELRALYLKVLDHPTSSFHKRYLVWKLIQARRSQ